jgi:hypothetical protein
MMTKMYDKFQIKLFAHWFGVLLIGAFVTVGWAQPQTQKWNGFNVNSALIDPNEILRGGPPKDGIPALTNPKTVIPERAPYLNAKDMVVGVRINGEARAYPLRILDWHENVNDVLGGKPIAVTYCPLCWSAMVFDRKIGGTVREFGISGLLWNSSVLLYDRQAQPVNESLWSQVPMKAVTGPAAEKGLRLKLLSSELTTWQQWVSNNPNTTVLSDQTGYGRNYQQTPYTRYYQNDKLMFPVKEGKKRPSRFVRKEPMLVIDVDGKLKAYAIKDIARAARNKGYIDDKMGKNKVRLIYTKESDTVQVKLIDKPDEQVPAATMFWFALSAMLPDIEVYESPKTGQ